MLFIPILIIINEIYKSNKYDEIIDQLITIFENTANKNDKV